MKTIEEKAKAYDEALVRANKMHELNSDVHKGVTEYIFPELQEYNNERIRTELLNEICCLRASEEQGSDRYNALSEMMRWLEDQKEEEGFDFTPVENTLEYKLGFMAGKKSKDNDWVPTPEQLESIRFLLEEYRPWLLSSVDARKDLRDVYEQLKKAYYGGSK